MVRLAGKAGERSHSRGCTLRRTQHDLTRRMSPMACQASRSRIGISTACQKLLGIGDAMTSKDRPRSRSAARAHDVADDIMNDEEVQQGSIDDCGDGGGSRGSDGNFTETEECLWIRVFGALEVHARPCRAESTKGQTQPDLVPLASAISVVRDTFGDGRGSGGGEAETTRQKSDFKGRWGSRIKGTAF